MPRDLSLMERSWIILPPLQASKRNKHPSSYSVGKIGFAIFARMPLTSANRVFSIGAEVV